MKDKDFALFIVGVVTWVITYNIWVLVGESTYYIGTAFMIAVCSYLINNVTKVGWQKIVSRFFLFISVNNLIDELLFDPTAFELNEYLTCIIYFIYTLWKHYTTLNTSSKESE